MPGNPLVRFDEGRVGRTARCRLLSYSTALRGFACDAFDKGRGPIATGLKTRLTQSRIRRKDALKTGTLGESRDSRFDRLLPRNGLALGLV